MFGRREKSRSRDGERRRRRPRALAHHLKISLATSAVLLASFVLFLLVGISLPIIKPVYIFSIAFATNPDLPDTSLATDLFFGVWGVCGRSALGDESCIGPMLGYTIPDSLLQRTGFPELAESVAKTLTVLLVLHLVAGGLAFIGAFTSLFLESQTMCIISLVTTIFTLLLGLVVFGIDLALIIIGRDKVPSLTEFQFVVKIGPALWMCLGGIILAFFGMILMSVVVCECCGVRRKGHDHERHHHHHHHDGY